MQNTFYVNNKKFENFAIGYHRTLKINSMGHMKQSLTSSIVRNTHKIVSGFVSNVDGQNIQVLPILLAKQ